MPGFLRPTFTCFARVAARPTSTIRIQSAEISESIAAVVRMADIAREARWRKARNPNAGPRSKQLRIKTPKQNGPARRPTRCIFCREAFYTAPEEGLEPPTR